MDENSPNPYQAPTSTGQPQAFTFKTGAFVACLAWALLAMGIRFESTLLAPIYQDWELEVPLITRMIMHPACPLVPAAAAVLLGLAAFYATPRQRYLMATWSFGLAFILALVALHAFFSPLILLIEGLN